MGSHGKTYFSMVFLMGKTQATDFWGCRDRLPVSLLILESLELEKNRKALEQS